jgi:uncharacterized membrane protein
MMHWGYMGSGGLMMAAVWVVGLLLVAAFVVVVTVLLQPGHPVLASTPDRSAPLSAAETELDLRYARGEIDAATLVEQRAVLRQRSSR